MKINSRFWVIVIISIVAINSCIAQNTGKVHIAIKSYSDGELLLYNSQFTLVDSLTMDSSKVSVIDFKAVAPDFYFIATKQGNKVFRQFINLYLKPGDSLQIVSNRMGMHFSGNATYLNDFTFNERYGLTNRYLEDSYNLEPIKASALFDSVRYARKVI